MKNLFELTIGIEVHVVLNSKTKMFSSSLSSHEGEVNNNINPIDLGHPGIMPSPNKKCIEKAIVLANALNMEIANKITFDRKNYFYQDLPKGFQITQQFNPIGKKGTIKLENGHIIEITRIHLEEDTAKQTKENGEILLDYNRSGMPLIEIVTEPCIKSSEDAALFLKELRRILIFNNISDAKMEEGSLRADINISVKPIGSKMFGTRVEIKNINSINNVEKAIKYEFEQQVKQTLKNEEILMCTKKYNDKSEETEFMRLKTTNVDYHYMVESNIFYRTITNEYINKTIADNFVDINKIKENLINSKVANEYINLLLDNIFLYKKYEKINNNVNDPNESIRWLCIELIGALSKANKTINEVSDFYVDSIIEIIKLLKENKINGKQAKEIIKLLIETNKDVKTIIEENNFKQITDKNVLKEILLKYISTNENMVKQYNDRPERVEKFFIGMVMKETNGQANPDITNEVFVELIKNK